MSHGYTTPPVLLYDATGNAITSHSRGGSQGIDTVLLDSDGTPFSTAHPMPVALTGTPTVIPDNNAYGNVGETFTATGDGSSFNIGWGLKHYSMQVVQTGTVTSWTAVLEVSLDTGTNWTVILTHTKAGDGNGSVIASSPFPATSFRVRVSALTLGAGTNIKVYSMATY